MLDNTRATASSPVCGDYGAVLAAIKDAARRAKRGGLRPSLTAAARDALGKRRSGRQHRHVNDAGVPKQRFRTLVEAFRNHARGD